MTQLPLAAPFPYDEWGRLTHFLQSARMAFGRERKLWESLDIVNPDLVRVSSRGYRATLKKHIDAMDDAEMLYASVLVHSYALAEFAAANHLAVESRSFRGIEDWGGQLLRTNGREWADVKGGLGGAVEAAVARNAIAHGTRTIDAAARVRLLRAGVETRPEGSPVTLGYRELCEFRARLKSLLNVGGVGHCSR